MGFMMQVNRMLKFKTDIKMGFREKLIIFRPAAALAILAFVVAFYFVDPLPPRRFSIGCGPPEGANFKFAQAWWMWPFLCRPILPPTCLSK
jgi:hypothetical protein